MARKKIPDDQMTQAAFDDRSVVASSQDNTGRIPAKRDAQPEPRARGNPRKHR